MLLKDAQVQHKTVISYHFRLHGDLQDARHQLAPEVQQDAGGGVVRLAARRRRRRQLLQVQGPQLAEDEGVE